MLKSFVRADNGNVAIMFGIFLFMLLIAGGMAVDFQRANLIRADLQESADAGLIAAVRRKMAMPEMTDAEVTAWAQQFFEANRRMKSGVEVTGFDVVFDPVTESYHLQFDSQIETLLLRVAGTPHIDRAVVSEAKLGKPPYLEIVMALDNTGSMNDDGKLQSLKDAAKLLVTSVFAPVDADVKIGLVPFAQYVNVGAGYSGAAWMSADPSFIGCVGSRSYPANIGDGDYTTNPIPGLDNSAECPNAILPMTDQQSTIETAIDAMSADGYTYIPAGLAWGWRALTSGDPFNEGVTFADLYDKSGRKALILMTDGENTKSPDYPTHDNEDIALANQLTGDLCDAIKAQDILVYTIAFQVTDTTIKFLLEDCGTTPAHYFAAENSDDLAAAFQSIASSLRSISLSR